MTKHLFKRAILAISILVAAASSLLATEQDDPRFAQWMENSRAAFANNHMIAYMARLLLNLPSRFANHNTRRSTG